MDSNIIDRLKYILEPAKAKIKYFSLSGSRTLDYITDQHDYDIAVVCISVDDVKEVEQVIRGIYDLQELKDTENIDLHFTSEEYEDSGIYQSHYPYLIRKRICYDWSDKIIEKETSIEEFLKHKDLIKSTLIATIQKLQNRNKNFEKFNWSKSKYYIKKIWYHYYITFCLLHNKSWELTEDQKKICNLLHDWKNLTLEIAQPIVDNLVENIENI